MRKIAQRGGGGGKICSVILAPNDVIGKVSSVVVVYLKAQPVVDVNHEIIRTTARAKLQRPTYRISAGSAKVLQFSRCQFQAPTASLSFPLQQIPRGQAVELGPRACS